MLFYHGKPVSVFNALIRSMLWRSLSYQLNFDATMYKIYMFRFNINVSLRFYKIISLKNQTNLKIQPQLHALLKVGHKSDAPTFTHKGMPAATCYTLLLLWLYTIWRLSVWSDIFRRYIGRPGIPDIHHRYYTKSYLFGDSVSATPTGLSFFISAASTATRIYSKTVKFVPLLSW